MFLQTGAVCNVLTGELHPAMNDTIVTKREVPLQLLSGSLRTAIF